MVDDFMNLEIEYIDNPDNFYWIWNVKICNKAGNRIYPLFDDSLSCGKTVAIYEVSDGGRVQIAQLAVPDYSLLEKAFSNGQKVNLNYMYIDRFNWLGDKKPYEVDEDIYNSIESFSADATFWNGTLFDDFIRIIQLKVKSKGVSFYYACFNHIKLDVSNIRIMEGNLIFDNARFYNCDIQICNIDVFGNQYFFPEISFRYTRGKTNKIQLDLIKQNYAVDLLDARLDDTDVNIFAFSKAMKEICLTKAKLKSVNIQNGSVDETDIREASIGQLRFKYCKLIGQVVIDSNVREIYIDDSIISDVFLLNSTCLNIFSLDNTSIVGRIYIRNAGRAINAIKEHLKNVDSDKVEQLLVLKENFRQIGEYENEDMCHLQYHHCKAGAEKNWIKRWGSRIIEYTCGYGTKPFRLLIFIIVIIMAFALIFYSVPFIQFTNVESFIDYLYVSGITFFTVGYGDIVPVTTITKLIVIVEAFLGVSLMSAFLALLTRKVIR